MLGAIEGLPWAVTFTLAFAVFAIALISFSYLKQFLKSNDTPSTKEVETRCTIPFPMVLRHLGHGSMWSVTKCSKDPSLWHRVAQREFLDHLARGTLKARGQWRGMDDGDNALRDIKREEWPKLGYPSGPMTERATDFIQSIGPVAGMYRYVELDRDEVLKLWPKWSFWVRVMRRFYKQPQSLAERTGEIEMWHKHNQDTPIDDDYYWRET